MIIFKEKESFSNLQLIEKLRKEIIGPLARSGEENEKTFLKYILIFLLGRFFSEDLCMYINENERRENNKRGIEDDFDYEYETNFSEEELSALKKSLKSEGFSYFLEPHQLFSSIYKNLYKGREGLANKVDEILKECIGKPQCSDYKNIFNDDRSLKNRIDRDIDLVSLDSPLGDNTSTKDEGVEKFIRTIMKLEWGQNEINPFGDFSQELVRKYFLFASTRPHKTQENISRLCIELSKQIFQGQKKLNVYDLACNGGNFLIKLRKEFRFKTSITFEKEKKNTLIPLINFGINGLTLTHFRSGNPLSENRDGEERFDIILANDSYPKQGILEFQKERFDRTHPKFGDSAIPRPCGAYARHSLYKLSSEGVFFLMATCNDLAPTAKRDEKEERMYFLKNGYIEAIIMLPRRADRFRSLGTAHHFGQSIVGPYLLVFRKNRARESPVLFINATREKVDSEGFLELGKILEVYRTKKEVEKFSSLISFEEIRKKGYSLTGKTFFGFIPENEGDIEISPSEEELSSTKDDESPEKIFPNLNGTDEEIKLYKDTISKTEKGVIRVKESNGFKMETSSKEKNDQEKDYKFLTNKQLREKSGEHNSPIKSVSSLSGQPNNSYLNERNKESMTHSYSISDSQDNYGNFSPNTKRAQSPPKQTDNVFLRENPSKSRENHGNFNSNPTISSPPPANNTQLNYQHSVAKDTQELYTPSKEYQQRFKEEIEKIEKEIEAKYYKRVHEKEPKRIICFKCGGPYPCKCSKLYCFYCQRTYPCNNKTCKKRAFFSKFWRKK